MIDLPLLRFIPFRRSDIIEMCLSEGDLSVDAVQQFRHNCQSIEEFFQHDFHGIKQHIKDAYAPLDPDADTRLLNEFIKRDSSADLVASLEQVLQRANYEKVTEQDLQRALRVVGIRACPLRGWSLGNEVTLDNGPLPCFLESCKKRCWLM